MVSSSYFSRYKQRLLQKDMKGDNEMKKRGFLGLLIDFVLTVMTGGLWLIWILIQYLRNGQRS